ncbi:signal recognition particle-docking protein FtsY [Pinisolibacter sp.]|uniref:signal recognition particle-docking protein FtsY n=1 Tax=Pinisolibacter sp. TaxID=2172024 RepID=UPI002FDDBBC2
MSEGDKRGLFGRWFGGKQPPAAATPPTAPEPAPEPTPETPATADVATATETSPTPPAAVPAPAPPSAEAVPTEVETTATPEAISAPELAVAPEPAPAPLEITPARPVEDAAPKKTTWWQKLKTGLSRTSTALGSGISAIFTKRKLDDDTLDELEDILIQADLGLATATKITDALRRDRYDKEITDHEVRSVLAAEVEKVLAPVAKPLDIASSHRPHVVLVVGVNGSGKTTTIGKLAMKLGREGKSVTLCAGDTFRAAAIEQLKIWGGRTGASVIAREPGADAASLAFDALAAAKSAGSDVLVIDTAGRLQNRAELMAELEKVVRVIKKQDPSAPHDVILTLDATTGQNAVNQVEIFGKVAGVTGLVMTKLDGTARGGILVAIAERFGLPVHFIGVGEGADDLEPFDAADFAGAIAGLERRPA